MWRQNALTANVDSDQSFSDEDDFGGDSSKNCVSLSVHAEIQREGGLQILSQLEKLRDASGSTLPSKCNLLIEKQKEFAPEDGLEIPNFANGSSLIFKPKWSPKNEDVISDDENNVILKFSITSRVQKGEETKHSAILSEAPILNRSNSNGNASCSSSHARLSNPNHNFGGYRRKSKPTLSFGSSLVKNEAPVPFISKNEGNFLGKACEVSEIHEDNGCRTMKQIDCFNEKDESDIELFHAEVPRGECSTSKHSMAVLLDGLQNRTDELPVNKEMSSRKRRQKRLSVVRRRTDPLRNRRIGPDEVPESMDSDSPEDEEHNDDDLKIPQPERKRNMLVDCFQEVLDATSLSSKGVHAAIPHPSGFGLFGKLQKVMQDEKERETEFLKALHAEFDTSGPSCCLNVSILSRCLEAKLIVCRCSFENTPERFQQSCVGFLRGQEITVIFNPRVCSNVDLEIGNLICIYPPWKEVRLPGSDDTILLITFFVQISMEVKLN